MGPTGPLWGAHGSADKGIASLASLSRLLQTQRHFRESRSSGPRDTTACPHGPAGGSVADPGCITSSPSKQVNGRKQSPPLSLCQLPADVHADRRVGCARCQPRAASSETRKPQCCGRSFTPTPVHTRVHTHTHCRSTRAHTTQKLGKGFGTGSPSSPSKEPAVPTAPSPTPEMSPAALSRPVGPFVTASPGTNAVSWEAMGRKGGAPSLGPCIQDDRVLPGEALCGPQIQPHWMSRCPRRQLSTSPFWPHSQSPVSMDHSQEHPPHLSGAKRTTRGPSGGQPG